MAYYCSISDVGSRLGLNSGQRDKANTRLTSAIRRATIDIDQCFRDYGRDVPSREIASTTLSGAVAAGANTITLTSASAFSSAGNGNIDGDSKPDFIVGTGTEEGVVWIEFVGSNPKDPTDYMSTTILQSKGEPLDRYYPLDISETDMDGDGKHEVVIANLFSTEASQPQIIVLEYTSFSWDVAGGNESLSLRILWESCGEPVLPLFATPSAEISLENFGTSP